MLGHTDVHFDISLSIVYCQLTIILLPSKDPRFMKAFVLTKTIRVNKDRFPHALAIACGILNLLPTISLLSL